MFQAKNLPIKSSQKFDYSEKLWGGIIKEQSRIDLILGIFTQMTFTNGVKITSICFFGKNSAKNIFDLSNKYHKYPVYFNML